MSIIRSCNYNEKGMEEQNVILLLDITQNFEIEIKSLMVYINNNWHLRTTRRKY
jgi:hypothetical protein